MIDPVEALRIWQKDPIKFVWDNFQVRPDIWQQKALIAYADQNNRAFRLSLQACVGPGKSAVLAWIGWHFLSCFGDEHEHPKGIAVSITGENLSSNLWPELSKWQQRSPYLSAIFQWTKTKIYCKLHPETWFLEARSWPQTANTEELGKTLSGLHSQYVLVLVDESGNIPVEILKAGDQALGNCTFGRIVQAGNPTSHSGMLYAAATRLREMWHVVRITGDPDDPDRSPRIDVEWARMMIRTYGRSDPWVKSSILGEFPDSAINTLLTIEEVSRAAGKLLRPEVYNHVQKRLGVDVARFGVDDTIIFPRQGLKAFNFVRMPKARSNEVAARVVLAKDKWGSEMEFVDGTGGFGAGVIDTLISAGSTTCQEINASSKATDVKFYNKRAECWWNMAEWIKRGGSIPNDPTLIKELVTPTYTFKDGKIIIQEKDQIKKLQGFSPDRADALSLTFAWPDMPTAIGPEFIRKQRGEYDPFHDQSRQDEEVYVSQSRYEYNPFDRN